MIWGNFISCSYLSCSKLLEFIFNIFWNNPWNTYNIFINKEGVDCGFISCHGALQGSSFGRQQGGYPTEEEGTGSWRIRVYEKANIRSTV